MPDIFGREAQQYQHLQALSRAGLLQQQLSQRAAQAGDPPHDFHSLGRGFGQVGFGVRPGGDGMLSRNEANAQAVGFLTNNLQALHSQIEEILYTEFRLPGMVPIITNVPEGAKTYAYRVVDEAGLGQFIENNGDSAPNANVAQRIVAYKLRYGGIVPSWTLEDLRNAAMTGIPLDTHTINAGMTGALNHIEQVAFTGIPEEDQAGGDADVIDVPGLINMPHQNSNPVGLVRQELLALPAGAVDGDDPEDGFFGGSTAEELRNMIVDRIGQVITDTEEVFGRTIRSGMCIYLPRAKYNYLTSTPFGDNRDKSVWDFIKMYNPWTEETGETPMLKSILELKNAGEDRSGTRTHRMVIAINDMRVWEMAIPIYPRVITTIFLGYDVKAPMEYKISALNLKRPSTIRYIDGI